MRSARSRLFNTFLRNRHLLKGKLSKPRYDFNTSIEGFREECEKGAARYSKIPDGIKIEKDLLDGIKVERIIPDSAPAGKIIMYMHGGGYVSGSCNDHRALVSGFALKCGITNLLYEYRLAPENPFPAALDDSVKVYIWLLGTGIKPENIVIAGESAGGGLCLAILLALKERSIPLPAAAAAISPWTDLTCSGESYKTKNKVSVAPLDSWTVFSRHYRGSRSGEDPFISPLFGNLKGLPPIFINSAVDDELFDDGEKFSQKAREAGVDVTFRAGEGMVHCYPLFGSLFREAAEAMDEICAFIRKHLHE